jgi:prepilin-type processing-associated H-X9-DG protein
VRGKFTLIEFLVVIAIIASMAAMLLPAWARSKHKKMEIGCLSNLKQLGRALQMYIDDNEDRFPGPLWNGVQAGCDAKSSEEFLYYAPPYLGVPPLSDETAVIPAAACPGYMHAVPGIGSMRDMEGRICYLLNPNVGPVSGAPVRPFGYPNPPEQPLKRSELNQYGSMQELFAITDVDKGNLTNRSVDWWSDLPNKPVHGSTRNQLFFDGHVTAVGAVVNAGRK